jgi:elongation factor P--(R)-beta-lysine ligase
MKDKSDLAGLRAQILIKLRHFFESRGFVEVQTPTLVKNPGLEPHLLYFETQFNPSMGGGQKEAWFLPTSPEYHLKKALSWGMPKIYEICKSFRNGEKSEEHEPEFLMLEWYRSPGDYKQIAEDTAELILHLGSHFNPSKKWGPTKHITVSEAFEKFCRIKLDEALSPGGRSLTKQALAAGFKSIRHNDTFEDTFNKLLVEFVEPQLGIGGPEFLWDYPAAFAALSRPHPQKPNYCERFEVYIDGIELANAFGELMDPAALRGVCMKDQAQRQRLHGKSPPLDEEFLDAVAKTPHKNVGGIALGLDRLIQVLIDAETLQDAMLFPKWG